MKRRGILPFVVGLTVGILCGFFSLSVLLGMDKATEKVEDLGVQVNKEDYTDFESKLQDIESKIESNYYIDSTKDDLYEGAYKGFVSGLNDPYSNYFSADEYKEFTSDVSGKYEGIGVVVGYDEETKQVMVQMPFKGSPGEQAGLLPGDVFLSVGDVQIEDQLLEDVVKMIRGDAGTTVNLKMYRPDTGKTYEVAIVREAITTPSVNSEVLEGDIGYIQITGFEEKTGVQFRAALDTLINDNHIKGLMIDLRNNPGGYLNVVGDIADRLLPEGLIVYTEDKNGKKQEMFSDNKESLDLPMVVLVNQHSASASEILAGALKDHQKATLVGKTTYGKGLVQTVFELEDGSAIKLTIAKYFTPNGNYINKVGITPDIAVENPEDLEFTFSLHRDQDTQFKTALDEMNKLITTK